MAKPTFDPSDVKENRVTGGIGYLIFFLPLILCPRSKYGRFCANQGLLLVIAEIVISIVAAVVAFALGWIPVIGKLIDIVLTIAKWLVGVLALYFAYLACVKGDARQIPGFGNISIIK